MDRSRPSREQRKGLAVPDSVDGFGLETFWWMAYGVAALVLLGVLLGAAYLFHGNEARLLEHHLQTYSGAIVQELGNRTAAVRGQLKRWSRDPGLRAALLDGRTAVLRSKEGELRLLVPGAVDVMVFENGGMVPGGEASRRLSFAGLDMVQRAQNQARIVPLEAHRVRQNDEHLAVAGPVMDQDGERVLGVVHIMLPMSLLPRTTPAVDEITHSSFRQQVGDTKIFLGAEPAQPPVSGVPSASLPVADTRLELFAWASPKTLVESDLLQPLGAVYLMGLLLLGSIVWLFARIQRQGVSADVVNMLALVEDAVAQRPMRRTRGRIRELGAATNALRRSLRDLSPARTLSHRSPDEIAAVAGQAPMDERPDDAPTDFDPGLPADGHGGLPADDPVIEASAVDARRSTTPAAADVEPPAAQALSVPASIFRAYDIRGLVGSEIDDRVMRALGRAVGSEAAVRGERICVVARDQRASGEALARALVEGLIETGCTVIDIGVAPSPLAYFAAHERGEASAAIVTASHNPADYNGLKVVLGGQAASEDQIQGLLERIRRGDFERGTGVRRTFDANDDYVRAVTGDITLARPMRVVVGCGFGAASRLAPSVYRALACDVIEFDCDPDMADIGESIDPSQPEQLQGLGDAVIAADADLGIAFDADGDRLGVVDSGGRAISADRLLMLLAADILARSPGSDIVYDVKCSHHLGASVLDNGGRPVMGRSGHSFLKQQVRDLGAPLGGEFSGHIMFADRWNGFDDATYAGARVLEVLALDPRPTAEVFAEYETGIGTPELFVGLPKEQEQRIMGSVLGMADRLDGVEVNTIDGLRAEFDQGWGLVRASNTRSGLVFRFEADQPGSLDKIQDLFRRMMRLVAPELDLPF